MKKYRITKTDLFIKLGFGGLLRRGHVQKKAVFPISKKFYEGGWRDWTALKRGVWTKCPNNYVPLLRPLPRIVSTLTPSVQVFLIPYMHGSFQKP